MTLFKKMKKLSLAEIELNYKFEEVKKNHEQIFYHHVFDEDKSQIEKWCKRNHIEMVLDHITNSTKIYRFICF